MKRSCRTCRWFRPDANRQSGRCTNPDLEQDPDLYLHIRARELHCRRGWDNDLWSATPDDIVLEIRFKTPDQDPTTRPALESILGQAEARTVEAIVRDWDALAEAEANTNSPRP